jgi:hypothetical protein
MILIEKKMKAIKLISWYISLQIILKFILMTWININSPSPRMDEQAFALKPVSQAWGPRRKCYELAKIYLETNQDLQDLILLRDVTEETLLKLIATKFNIDNREIKAKDGAVYRIKADVMDDGYLHVALINDKGQESSGVLSLDACQEWSGDLELKKVTFSGLHYENLAGQGIGGQIVSMASEFLDGEVMANLVVEQNTVSGILEDNPKNLKELLESFGKYPIGRMFNKVGITNVVFRYFPKGIIMSGLLGGVAVTDKTLDTFINWLNEARSFALQVTIKIK